MSEVREEEDAFVQLAQTYEEIYLELVNAHGEIEGVVDLQSEKQTNEESDDEENEYGLGCGLMAKITTEAYKKALERGQCAFAAFFPANSKNVYLLKVSVCNETHDFLEPATKEDVKEAYAHRNQQIDLMEEEEGDSLLNDQVAVVAFVKQTLDETNKSTQLNVEPPSGQIDKLKLFKKGEFVDYTILVQGSENDENSATVHEIESTGIQLAIEAAPLGIEAAPLTIEAAPLNELQENEAMYLEQDEIIVAEELEMEHFKEDNVQVFEHTQVISLVTVQEDTEMVEIEPTMTETEETMTEMINEAPQVEPIQELQENNICITKQNRCLSKSVSVTLSPLKQITQNLQYINFMTPKRPQPHKIDSPNPNNSQNNKSPKTPSLSLIMEEINQYEEAQNQTVNPEDFITPLKQISNCPAREVRMRRACVKEEMIDVSSSEEEDEELFVPKITCAPTRNPPGSVKRRGRGRPKKLNFDEECLLPSIEDKENSPIVVVQSSTNSIRTRSRSSKRNVKKRRLF